MIPKYRFFFEGKIHRVYGLTWLIDREAQVEELAVQIESVITSVKLGQLMQWTGLVDMNDQPIFTDHIIKLDEDYMKAIGADRQYCLVGFDEGAFMFGRSSFDPWSMNSYLWLAAKHNDRKGYCEILGNIHENGNLLEIQGYTLEEMKKHCDEFKAKLPEMVDGFFKELLEGADET